MLKIRFKRVSTRDSKTNEVFRSTKNKIFFFIFIQRMRFLNVIFSFSAYYVWTRKCGRWKSEREENRLPEFRQRLYGILL